MTQTVISLTIFLYVSTMLLLGYLTAKKNSSVTDFYLGGRSLGPLVTALSADASDMSSWLLMGLPGLAYLTGIADAGWTALGLALGTIFNWKIVALRLRRFSHTLNAITIPSFFSQRFADHRHKISALSAYVMILFFIPYTTSAFVACGKLFSTIFQIEYMTAMVFSALVIVLYTISGGFLAVSFTDMMQSIMMFFALVFVFQFSMGEAGGFREVLEHSHSLEGYFSLFHQYDPLSASAEAFPLWSILTSLAWGLGYFGMPHVLLRFMAIEDERKLPLARGIACTWTILSLSIALMIGIAGNTLSANGKLPILADAEVLLVQLAQILSTHSLGFAVIGGLVLAGILAATMSTADSQLLVASSAISKNIIEEYYGKELSPFWAAFVARASVLAVALIALLLASDPSTSIFSIVSFAWAGFGASFGPVLILSLFWRRANLQGAMAGILSGAVMVFYWRFQLAPLGGVFGVYELLPSFLVGLGMMVIVTLLTPPPNHEVELIFDASMMPVPPPRPIRRPKPASKKPKKTEE